jgi:hypothetical protein
MSVPGLLVLPVTYLARAAWRRNASRSDISGRQPGKDGLSLH